MIKIGVGLHFHEVFFHALLQDTWVFFKYIFELNWFCVTRKHSLENFLYYRNWLKGGAYYEDVLFQYLPWLLVLLMQITPTHFASLKPHPGSWRKPWSFWKTKYGNSQYAACEADTYIYPLNEDWMIWQMSQWFTIKNITCATYVTPGIEQGVL